MLFNVLGWLSYGVTSYLTPLTSSTLSNQAPSKSCFISKSVCNMRIFTFIVLLSLYEPMVNAAARRLTQQVPTVASDKVIMTGIAAHINLPTWKPNGDPCMDGDWTGVQCDSNGYITIIDLANRQLDGEFRATASHFIREASFRCVGLVLTFFIST